MIAAVAVVVAVAVAAAAPGTADAPAHSAASHSGPKKVLVADARAHEGVDAAIAAQVSKIVAKRLAATPGLVVTSGDELRAILNAEAEKQLMGCGDGSCFAEIAEAMDADVVVGSDVTKLGDLIVVDLLAVRAHNASSASRARTQIYRLDDLAVRVDDAARDLVKELVGAPAPVAKPSSAAPLALGVTGAVVAAAGVVAVVVGVLPAVAYAQASADLTAAGARYQAGDDKALDDLARLHADVEKDRQGFASWGEWTVVAGAAAIAAGAGIAAAALFLPEEP